MTDNALPLVRLCDKKKIEAPSVLPSQTSQPSSARVKAPKRPAPEGSASTASEGASSSSRPVSDDQPSQPTTWDLGQPITAFSENPHHPPIGAHPYQRGPPSPAGKDKGKGKGAPANLSYADIASKGKKGQKGQKSKGHKGFTGPKGPKGDSIPVLQGGKATPKGDTKQPSPFLTSYLSSLPSQSGFLCSFLCSLLWLSFRHPLQGSWLPSWSFRPSWYHTPSPVCTTPLLT